MTDESIVAIVPNANLLNARREFQANWCWLMKRPDHSLTVFRSRLVVAEIERRGI